MVSVEIPKIVSVMDELTDVDFLLTSSAYGK
jgi:hypothetical protein